MSSWRYHVNFSPYLVEPPPLHSLQLLTPCYLLQCLLCCVQLVLCTSVKYDVYPHGPMCHALMCSLSRPQTADVSLDSSNRRRCLQVPWRHVWYVDEVHLGTGPARGGAVIHDDGDLHGAVRDVGFPGSARARVGTCCIYSFRGTCAHPHRCAPPLYSCHIVVLLQCV